MLERKAVESSLNLADYEISDARGFLPEDDPLLALPDYFEAWEEAALHLPKIPCL